MRYALVLPLAGVLAALAAARADEPARKEKESAVKRIDLTRHAGDSPNPARQWRQHSRYGGRQLGAFVGATDG